MRVGERVKNKVITNIFVKKAKRSRKCAVTYWIALIKERPGKQTKSYS